VSEIEHRDAAATVRAGADEVHSRAAERSRQRRERHALPDGQRLCAECIIMRENEARRVRAECYRARCPALGLPRECARDARRQYALAPQFVHVERKTRLDSALLRAVVSSGTITAAGGLGSARLECARSMAPGSRAAGSPPGAGRTFFNAGKRNIY